MQYRVELTGRAKRDLRGIYEFIQAETLDQAALWFNGLHAALRSLADMPQRSPIIREDIATRHLLYGNRPHVYRAIYVIDEEKSCVTILSIRHGARGAFQTKRRPSE